MVNILCMKWGTKYGAEYVNKLHSMVARHLTLPHRFVCLTDDADGIYAHIETFAIPELPIAPEGGRERNWKKLVTFSKNLYDLSGPTLFLDLDIVITGSLDDFFMQHGDVLIIKEWVKQHGLGNSSVFRFNIGQHADVLEYFIKNFPSIQNNFRHEQAYLCEYLLKKGALDYWPETWCYSFKRHCLHYFPKSLFSTPKFPVDARILIFHGHPSPAEAIVGKTGKWYRFARPAHWLKSLWC